MTQQTRRVRAGHPAMNNTEYLRQLGFKPQAEIDIEASQRAFMDSCEPKKADFPDHDRWTFSEWLFAFLFGFCVLMACAAVILSI